MMVLQNNRSTIISNNLARQPLNLWKRTIPTSATGTPVTSTNQILIAFSYKEIVDIRFESPSTNHETNATGW